MKKTLCPFSKPIIGNWCQCKYANMDERCAGKMTCLEAEQYISGCYELVDAFKEKSRFILGLSQNDNELTHMQLMKIRCGGLIGMQRVLSGASEIPDVLDIKNQAQQQYGDVLNFPFSEIVRDIKIFTHRTKRK
jgi:hypothetical protein